MARYSGCLLALLFNCSVAHAADISDIEQPCSKATHAAKSGILQSIESGLVSAALNDRGEPVFLLWSDTETPGDVKAAAWNAAGMWRVISVAEHSTVAGAYRSTNGSVMIFTMWSQEGPGPEFNLLRTDVNLGTNSCGIIPFPDTLNKPNWSLEYLELLDFNGLVGGVVSLTTEIANDEDQSLGFSHYAYSSLDGGKSWSKPQGKKSPPAALNGDFASLVRITDAGQLVNVPEILR